MKPVVLVTDAARAKVLELLAEEDDGTPMGLRIEITGENPCSRTQMISSWRRTRRWFAP